MSKLYHCTIKRSEIEGLTTHPHYDMRHQDLWEEFVLNGGSFGSTLLSIAMS